MRPIPKKLREELNGEERMKTCVLIGKDFGICEGRIEFHHVFIYAGKQISERWAIVGVCHKHHEAVGIIEKLKKRLKKYL